MRPAVCLLVLKHQAPVFVVAGARSAWLTMVPSNNSLERAVGQRGPRLAAARGSWPAAQLSR